MNRVAPVPQHERRGREGAPFISMRRDAPKEEALQQRPAWPWVLVQGIVDLVLGVMIFREWPESSLWVIGLFVGIDLLFHGWTWVVLALAVRSHAPPAAV